MCDMDQCILLHFMEAVVQRTLALFGMNKGIIIFGDGNNYTKPLHSVFLDLIPMNPSQCTLMREEKVSLLSLLMSPRSSLASCRWFGCWSAFSRAAMNLKKAVTSFLGEEYTMRMFRSKVVLLGFLM